MSSACFEGLPVTRAEVDEGQRWLDWDVFAEIIDRLEDLVGRERMVEVGRFALHSEVAGPLRRVAGVAVKLHHVYRFFRWPRSGHGARQMEGWPGAKMDTSKQDQSCGHTLGSSRQPVAMQLPVLCPGIRAQ